MTSFQLLGCTLTREHHNWPVETGVVSPGQTCHISSFFQVGSKVCLWREPKWKYGYSLWSGCCTNWRWFCNGVGLIYWGSHRPLVKLVYLDRCDIHCSCYRSFALSLFSPCFLVVIVYSITMTLVTRWHETDSKSFIGIQAHHV